MTTTTTILDYKNAGYPALWVETFEPQRTIAGIQGALGAGVYVWDRLQGVSTQGVVIDIEKQSPIEAIDWLRNAPDDTVLCMFHLHLFVEGQNMNGSVVQAVHNAVDDLKRKGKMLIGLVPPGARLPRELDRVFQLYQSDLPDQQAMGETLDDIAKSAKAPPSAEERQAILDAAAGCTAMEAENAMALGVAQGGYVVAQTVAAEKATRLKKSGLLEMYQGTERFEDLGGLDNLKKYLLRAVNSPSKLARGIVMTGFPGCGKSMIAKAIGNELRIPAIKFNIGACFGSLMGETEANMRHALATIEAMGTCVVLIDEVEKATAGMASSGQTDSGTTSRSMGTLLSWMQDRQGGAFIIATCNNAMIMPPELLRPGRFDATFFVDFPSLEERVQILAIHSKRFGLSKESHGDWPVTNRENWTGAEIEALCRQAKILDLPFIEAEQYVTPIYKTRKAEMDALRAWAATRCIPATSPVAPPTHARPTPEQQLSTMIAASRKINKGKGN